MRIDKIHSIAIMKYMELSDAITKKLVRAGLSDKEALVYSALINLGGAFPSKIAEQTKLSRSTVYKILLDLSVKGLVNEIEKRNKLFYQIESPTRITKYLKAKVSIAKDELEKAEGLVPELENIYAFSAHKQKVTYFEGLESVIGIYESHVTCAKPYTMLAWSNTEYLESFLKNNFSTVYRKEKEKKGILTRAIIPDSESGRAFVRDEYQRIGVSEKFWPEIRFVSKNKFLVSGEITIYDEDKVSIVNLNPDRINGTIIQDKAIHDMMRMIFELSWDGAAQNQG